MTHHTLTHILHRWTGICIGLFIFCSASAQLNTDRITAIGRNASYFEDYVLSIQYFNQVIRLKPYLADPYLYRAIAKIQLEDYAGASTDCDDAIRCNPFMPNAYYTRSFVRMHLNQLADAKKDLQEALVFAPNNRIYLRMMEELDGALCLQQQDTTQARLHYAHLAQQDSTNAFAWSALGTVELMQDSIESALTHISKAISLGSKWAGDYINRGIIYYHQHQYRQSLNDYDQAVELAPKEAQSYYNRAMLRHELGDYNRALEDYDKAISFDPYSHEMYYQRSLTKMQLAMWRQAISDLDTVILHYPYFLPSYYVSAQAYNALGNSRKAYQMRQKAYELEQNRSSIIQNRKPNTDTHMSTLSRTRDRKKEFSIRLAQNQQENDERDQKYDSETRGNIQKKNVDVINEPNIVLTFYAQRLPARLTNYTHPSLDQLNPHLAAPLHYTGHELALTPDMVNQHFTTINRLHTPQTALEYFQRAIELATVQDYYSAIDDCTRAANLAEGDTLLQISIYFCRANWRWKMLEVMRSTQEGKTDFSADFDIMQRDYDHVQRLDPNFAFSYYNQANILCLQRAFSAAIQKYSRAIQVDPDFAEAYFNRGLTYIYTDQVEQGLNDLSKAGELGIYQAYNLITRFQ